MQKSTYIITLLLSTIIFSFSSPASEMKEDEQKAAPYDLNHVKPIPLDCLPYEKWPQNREIIYSPRLFGSQGFEDIVNTKDERKKISKLDLKISPNKKPVNIADYIVKLHSYYGAIMEKEIAGDGTATIIKKEAGIIYLLTCAHNVVKHMDLDPFNPESTVSYFYAKSVSFSYEGKIYPCNKYYVHPHYNYQNEYKDIAVVASHRGFSYLKNFIFTFDSFPEIVSTSSSKEYEGYIIGYPGEKEKKNHLYGMAGTLNISRHSIEYDNIDTSKGQSGSPILAKINGIYKIIGIHTNMNTEYNWGICIRKDIIQWEKGCWTKTKKLYDNNLKIFSFKENMKIVLEQPNLDINMKSVYRLTPFLHAAKNGKLFALKLLQAKGANVNETDEEGWNALHLAIGYDAKYEVIKWLVTVAKVNVNAKNKWDRTPFIWASYKGNLPALKILKEKGTNANATDQDGNNALHLATKENVKYEVIEWLVKVAKVNVNAEDKRKYTPFLYAFKKGSLPLFTLLKEKGANINVTDEYGNNALHWAIKNNIKFEVIEWLVKVAKVSINVKNKWHNIPFLYAVKKSSLPLLTFLNEKGANINVTDQYGKNALHWAIKRKVEFEVIEWLVNIAKVDVNAKDRRKDTPFLWAAWQGNLPTLKLFKEKGANVNATDQYGNNALHWAIKRKAEFEVIEWLVNVAKVNVNAKDSRKDTPFLFACKKENLPVLKLLKEKGAHINATDQDGNNALHVAINNSTKFEIIEWLVKIAKINVHAKSNREVTPFLLATEKENIPVLKLLKEKGTHINATDQDSNNALHLASSFSPERKGIQWLIDMAKIDIESKGQYQKTPFLCAAQEGNLTALKFFKEKGANVNATDQYGNNALHLVTLFSPEDKGIQWLIDTAKIDIESKGGYQKTPFLCAAQKGNLPALKFFKEKGANINEIDQYGNNALHFAALSSLYGEGIQWLIDMAKIDIESKGRYQRTPFLCAARQGNLPALKLLKEKGANINVIDQDGNNALWYAKKFSVTLKREATITWLKNECGLQESLN